MRGLMGYSGMVAKVRAMTGKLIKEKEYEEMAGLHTVSEVAEYLNRYLSYRNLFREGTDNLQRTRMEDILRYTILRDFHRLYLFAGMEQRKFLDIYYLRFESALLKRCLRNIFDGRTREPYGHQEETAFFEQHSSLNIRLLSQVRSVEEFLDGLKGTAFYPVLKKIEESGKPSLFEYENALNLYFMRKMIVEYKKVLKKQDLEAITGIYGVEVDLLNLQWIYRAKKYYRMEQEEIQSILIPIHYKIKEDMIRQLMEASGVEDIRSLLKRSYYQRYAEEESDTLSIESLYRKLIGNIRSLYILKYPYSVACMENYLYRKETEVDKLTTLVEGIRFGIDAQEIKSYIL